MSNNINTLKFLPNSLAVNHPEVCLDWHPTKNLPLVPTAIGSFSQKKVWWQCHICKHEWEASINNRVKSGKLKADGSFRGSKCPNCIGRVVNDNNSFAAKNPELVEEWEIDKNLPKTPQTVFPTTIQKFMWKCNSCNHEYLTSCQSRSCGSKCPVCNKKVFKLNESIVKEIRRLWEAGSSDKKELCNRFNISITTIRRIINRKTWRNI